MVEQDTHPEIKADPQKAILVIFRGTSFGAAPSINFYIDRILAGQTRGKSYFITKVEPGSHYVIANLENNSCVKIKFEAGKIYYLSQGIFPGAMSSKMGFNASNPQDFERDRKNLIFYAGDPQLAPPMMKEDEYNRTITDYEKEVKEHLERNKDTADLQGY